MPSSNDIIVPDLSGRLAVVTGATDGIGYHIAERLARAGAELVLPARNAGKADAAANRLRRAVPGARVEVGQLDLSSLASVSAFADGFVDLSRPLHILINNAGVMAPPTPQLTEEGNELQFATNHLGHFALTMRVLPMLTAGAGRVTTQVSIAAARGSVNWDDISFEGRYHAMRAYRSSKIAAGLFGLELQRRSDEQGWSVTSNLSHPGIAPTNLLEPHPEMGRSERARGRGLIEALSRRGVLAGTPETAALSAVYASACPDATGGALYGPGGFRNLRGLPVEQRLYKTFRSSDDARRLWELSERLSGVSP